MSRSKPEFPMRAVALVIPFFIVVFMAASAYKVVPAGHVAVATLFGSVVDEPFAEGLKFPVNPLYSWTEYDARQKTHKEQADVPSQDQLQTEIDVSVQYRLINSMAPRMLQDTGTPEQVLEVHLVPKLRSLLREQGKTVKRAEDFFLEETQANLQGALRSGLAEYLEPKGIAVQDVLIRDINLPPFIVKAIESKKEREQETQKQKAEFERFKIEQQQMVVTAEAQREAAEQKAQQQKVLADARAYEIEKINEAVKSNPSYIQLQALETLREMSDDPATKLYFLDGNSPSPLPLMHIGEQ